MQLLLPREKTAAPKSICRAEIKSSKTTYEIDNEPGRRLQDDCLAILGDAGR